MPHAMPTSWSYVANSQSYLHDSGDFVVWQSCRGGWFGYSRASFTETGGNREQTDPRLVGPFESPQKAALSAVSNHNRLASANGRAQLKRTKETI